MWDSTGNALPVNRVKHLCSVTVVDMQEGSTRDKDRIFELEDLLEKVSINPTLLTSCMYYIWLFNIFLMMLFNISIYRQYEV